MDALIVIGTLLVCISLGVPIAYALGLSAMAAAWWIDIPLEAVMLQVSSGGLVVLGFRLGLLLQWRGAQGVTARELRRMWAWRWRHSPSCPLAPW